MTDNLQVNKMLVVSIPKSGTYLVNGLLERLGYENTNFHIGITSYQNYSEVSLSEARQNPRGVTEQCPASTVLSGLPAGSLAVTHLGPRDVTPFYDGKTVFLYRDLRDVVISFGNWISCSGRWSSRNGWKNESDGRFALSNFLLEHGASIAAEIHAAASWSTASTTVDVCFEAIIGRQGKLMQFNALDQIRKKLCVQRSTEELHLCLVDVLEGESITKVEKDDKRFSRADWTRDIEKQFRELGLHEINTQLGYMLDDSWLDSLPSLLSSQKSLSVLRKQLRRFNIAAKSLRLRQGGERS